MPSHLNNNRIIPEFIQLYPYTYLSLAPMRLQQSFRLVPAITLISFLLVLLIAFLQPAIAQEPTLTPAISTPATPVTPAGSTSSPSVAPKPKFDSMAEAQASLIPRIREFYGGENGYRGIVSILFLVIGPIKIIPAFVKLTAHADKTLRQQFAFRGFVISTITIILTALIGYHLLVNYNIPLTAIVTAGGLLLTLVALQIVLSQYGDDESSPPPEKPSFDLVIQPLVFPAILSPYGIAVVITLSALARELGSDLLVLLLTLIAIMVVNWITMLYARQILKFLTPLVLKGAALVLGVVQLSLGLGLIFSAMEIQALVLKELLSN